MPPKNLPSMPPGHLPGAPAGFPGAAVEKPPPSPGYNVFKPAKLSGSSRNISPGNGPGKVVGFFAIFVLFVGILWYLFGGNSAERWEETKMPAASTTTSKIAVPIPPITPEEIPSSLYAGWATLSVGTAATDVYPEKEYVIVNITQKNLSAVDISGWTLKNTSGMSAVLGLQPEVKGGDKLIIATGKSPTGASFRINKCSGFLEQFLDFIPELKKSCPTTSSLVSYKTLEKSCQNFIKTIPTCETNVKEYPPEISQTCRYYISTTVGYNACVAQHKNEKGFYLNEWRIFLNQDEELWAAKGEAIMLLDAEEKLIASVKY